MQERLNTLMVFSPFTTNSMPWQRSRKKDPHPLGAGDVSLQAKAIVLVGNHRHYVMVYIIFRERRQGLSHENSTHPGRTIRTPRRLSLCTALHHDPGRRRQRSAHPSSGRRPSRRPAGAVHARPAGVELSVPQGDPASDRRRHAGDRPGPGRLRQVGQTRGPGGLQLRAAGAVDG